MFQAALTGSSTATGPTTVSAGGLLVDGSLGNTTVTVANGALLGGDGNDSLDGAKGNELCQGEGDDERLKGKGGNDTLDGGEGENLIDAGGGKNKRRNGASAKPDNQFNVV